MFKTPAELPELIAFIKNRRTEVPVGEYDHFMYGEVLEELYRLEDLEN